MAVGNPIINRFSQLGDSLLSSTLLQRISVRYANLRQRDQLALKCLAGFLACVLAYSVLLAPAQSYAEKARDEAARNQQTLLWMLEHKASFKPAVAESSLREPDQSLLSASSSSAKSWDIAFKRFEPVDEAAVKVWLEDVNFNNLIKWIEELDKNYNIAVRELALEQNPDGAVSANLVVQE